jgi:hypothetical protein
MQQDWVVTYLQKQCWHECSNKCVEALLCRAPHSVDFPLVFGGMGHGRLWDSRLSRIQQTEQTDMLASPTAVQYLRSLSCRLVVRHRASRTLFFAISTVT